MMKGDLVTLRDGKGPLMRVMWHNLAVAHLCFWCDVHSYVEVFLPIHVIQPYER